jgi:hypothetical protein
MNRRTVSMLLGAATLGLAMVGSTQPSFAQSNPMIGTWKLNVEKSKFAGPPVKESILTYTQDGQNLKGVNQTTDAQGKTETGIFLHIYDGMPHPTTGVSVWDASAYTRVDANTLITARFKDGRLVSVGSLVLSQDGKTMTGPQLGISPGGQSGNITLVYEKQ